jgi:hypothetical protein
VGLRAKTPEGAATHELQLERFAESLQQNGDALNAAASMDTDPQMFDTDLTRDYAAATSFGLSPRLFYDAGDAATKERVRAIGKNYDWRALEGVAL